LLGAHPPLRNQALLFIARQPRHGVVDGSSACVLGQVRSGRESHTGWVPNAVGNEASIGVLMERSARATDCLLAKCLTIEGSSIRNSRVIERKWDGRYSVFDGATVEVAHAGGRQKAGDERWACKSGRSEWERHRTSTGLGQIGTQNQCRIEYWNCGWGASSRARRGSVVVRRQAGCDARLTWRSADGHAKWE